MDLALHIPLYKALLLFLRSMASSSMLVPLFLSIKEQSIHSLLEKLNTIVTRYTARLEYGN